MIGVRYRPDSSSEPVVELVGTEQEQARLVRHLILNQGRQAEPVTLLPQPDPAALAKVRRDIVEDAINDYVADEISDDQVFGILIRLQPALDDLDDATEAFDLIREAAKAYEQWMQVQDPNFELRSVEPELRDGAELVARYRVLLDQELDALMSFLDSCHQEAGDTTETHDEARGAA